MVPTVYLPIQRKCHVWFYQEQRNCRYGRERQYRILDSHIMIPGAKGHASHACMKKHDFGIRKTWESSPNRRADFEALPFGNLYSPTSGALFSRNSDFFYIFTFNDKIMAHRNQLHPLLTGFAFHKTATLSAVCDKQWWKHDKKGTEWYSLRVNNRLLTMFRLTS